MFMWGQAGTVMMRPRSWWRTRTVPLPESRPFSSNRRPKTPLDGLCWIEWGPYVVEYPSALPKRRGALSVWHLFARSDPPKATIKALEYSTKSPRYPGLPFDVAHLPAGDAVPVKGPASIVVGDKPGAITNRITGITNSGSITGITNSRGITDVATCGITDIEPW